MGRSHACNAFVISRNDQNVTNVDPVDPSSKVSKLKLTGLKLKFLSLKEDSRVDLFKITLDLLPN